MTLIPKHPPSANIQSVRHAAVYGIGVLAQVGGPNFAQALAESVPIIVTMIEKPEYRSEEHIDCTENAISAMGM